MEPIDDIHLQVATLRNILERVEKLENKVSPGHTAKTAEKSLSPQEGKKIVSNITDRVRQLYERTRIVSDPVERAKLQINIAELFIKVGLIHNATCILQDITAIMGPDGVSNKETIKIITDTVEIFYQLKQDDTIAKLTDRVLERVEQIHDNWDRSESLSHVVSALINIGQFDEALKLTEKFDDWFWIQIVFGEISGKLKENGEILRAYKTSVKLLDKARKFGRNSVFYVLASLISRQVISEDQILLEIYETIGDVDQWWN